MFDLTIEYLDDDRVRREEDVSVGDVIEQVHEAVEENAAVMLSFETDDHVLSFENGAGREWHAVIVWRDGSRPDLTRAGLSTEHVTDILARYAGGDEWLALLDPDTDTGWTPIDRDAIVDTLQTNLADAWDVNPDFSDDRIELRSTATVSQLVLAYDRIHAVTPDEEGGVIIDAADEEIIVMADGGVAMMHD